MEHRIEGALVAALADVDAAQAAARLIRPDHPQQRVAQGLHRARGVLRDALTRLATGGGPVPER